MSRDDWHQLTNEQREALDKLRERSGEFLQQERVIFEQTYPDLRLSWHITIDALIGKPQYQDL